MYTIRTGASFDSAHFLKDYPGKCSHLHGHRWKVEIETESEDLADGPAEGGMVTDFSVLKDDLKSLTDPFDHILIIEKGSLSKETMDALSAEGFPIAEVSFRPTAENFAKFFFDGMKKLGHPVSSCTVYETPNNSATYRE